MSEGAKEYLKAEGFHEENPNLDDFFNKSDPKRAVFGNDSLRAMILSHVPMKLGNDRLQLATGATVDDLFYILEHTQSEEKKRLVLVELRNALGEQPRVAKDPLLKNPNPK